MGIATARVKRQKHRLGRKPALPGGLVYNLAATLYLRSAVLIGSHPSLLQAALVHVVLSTPPSHPLPHLSSPSSPRPHSEVLGKRPGDIGLDQFIVDGCRVRPKLSWSSSAFCLHLIHDDPARQREGKEKGEA